MAYPRSPGSEIEEDRRRRRSREWRSSPGHSHHRGRDRHRDRRRREQDEESAEEMELGRRKRRRSRSDQRSRSRSPRRAAEDERSSHHRHRRSSRKALDPSPSHVTRAERSSGEKEREEEKEKENDDDDDNDAEVRRQRPNFQPTGRLAAESNTLAGIVLKYHEPAEARKPAPDAGWRLYVFKGADLLETIELGSRSCWLFGRERTVADFPLDHPSSSKQHAVVQFRYLVKTNEFGDKDGMVRPYLIDLESANGTMVNGDHIPATRYVELRHKDMIQFGLSTREYVLMSAAKE